MKSYIILSTFVVALCIKRGVAAPYTEHHQNGARDAGPLTSPDGTCGGVSGYTCRGSSQGSCCNASGLCGQGDDFCGTGCQSAFGSCNRISISLKRQIMSLLPSSGGSGGSRIFNSPGASRADNTERSDDGSGNTVNDPDESRSYTTDAFDDRSSSSINTSDDSRSGTINTSDDESSSTTDASDDNGLSTGNTPYDSGLNTMSIPDDGSSNTFNTPDPASVPGPAVSVIGSISSAVKSAIPISASPCGEVMGCSTGQDFLSQHFDVESIADCKVRCTASQCTYFSFGERTDNQEGYFCNLYNGSLLDDYRQGSASTSGCTTSRWFNALCSV